MRETIVVTITKNKVTDPIEPELIPHLESLFKRLNEDRLVDAGVDLKDATVTAKFVTHA